VNQGVNIPPRGQISPRGARGEVKNDPQVALVVALVELLLLLSACCFADHIRKLQRGDSEKSNSEKEGIMDSNEEAYSIHHEESKTIASQVILRLVFLRYVHQ
jgi:hypothetical protein